MDQGATIQQSVKTLLLGELHAQLKVIAKQSLLWLPLASLCYGIYHYDRAPILSFTIFYLIGFSCLNSGVWGNYILHCILELNIKGFGRKRRPLLRVTSLTFFTIPGLILSTNLMPSICSMAGVQCQPLNVGSYIESWLIAGSMVLASVYFFEYSHYRSQVEAMNIQIKTIENEKLKVQLSALIAQLNPHFLFNSLNTIAATIPENAAKAEEMTVQLSELYRSLLNASKGSVHPIRQELELIGSYLAIEKARFDERVKFQLEIDPELNQDETMIPVMLLQPIIENAIKHGISQKIEGGTIFLRLKTNSENLVIEVEDNGVGRNARKSRGSGVGLENCRRRIEAHYGKNATLDCEISDKGACVKIYLPKEAF